MNKYERTPEQIIDLHGHTTNEAEEVLRGFLCETFERKKNMHIRLIVGRGSHGVNGPVLRNFVKQYLSMRGIRFNQSKP